MIKSKEKTLIKASKKIEEIEAIIKDFNDYCEKRAKGSDEYEDYSRLSELALDAIISAKTQLSAILDY